ncbi:MAG: hypothetical protein JSU94_09115 [Phycisphaerales bacterium]|nr:MAG: hypothetical protein JSU94_09115 [Phycisphaerales bacterium]
MSAGILREFSLPEHTDIVFLHPEPPGWPPLLARNRQIVESIPGRSKSRQELLAAARSYTERLLGSARPPPAGHIDFCAVTGHQAIWHHCGILAKDFAVQKLARTTGGLALHLVLDHDIRDTAMVLPPTDRDRGLRFERVQIESEQMPVPLEFRPPPPKNTLETFIQAVTKTTPASLCGQTWPKCDPLQSTDLSRFANIADFITYCQATLKDALGLGSIVYLPVSNLSRTDAFAAFLCSIILDAEAFAAAYNNAIDKHAAARRGTRRPPIRKLTLDTHGGLIELPFWVVSTDGRRSSLHVRTANAGRVGIGTVSTELANLDPAWLSKNPSRLANTLHKLGHFLRPKAVPLTLFVRLFLADWFVHGLGGATYEPVTDNIIREYYHIEPPAFGVATCTMTLNTRNQPPSPKSPVAQLTRRLRDIRHNPEKYIDRPTLKTAAVASLIGSKRQLVAKATDRSLPGDARSSAYASLVAVNERLFEYARTAADRTERQMALSHKNALSKKVADYREFFFGLFPQQRLAKTAASLTFDESE